VIILDGPGTSPELSDQMESECPPQDMRGDCNGGGMFPRDVFAVFGLEKPESSEHLKVGESKWTANVLATI
jgi:hypothetical protein